jgi:hypothetical protein
MDGCSHGQEQADCSRLGSPKRRGVKRIGASFVVGALGLGGVGGIVLLPAPNRAAAAHRPVAVRHRARAVPARVVPIVRPPLHGEGVWHAGSFDVGGSAPIRFATLRPDPANPSVLAYVAWIDHTRTRLALYPGYANPPTAAPRGSGEVPYGQRWRLLATFNGGFKWKAGPAGFLINGRADEPLLPGLGTIVAHPDGRVDIVRWHGPSTLPTLTLARQNLRLLVDNGRPDPNVDNVAEWGTTLGGGTAVWRTSIGIDRHGNLLYAAADQQTPSSLAALMIHVGAARAIELDINPEWVSFNGYAKRGGRNPIKLVPNPQESSARWLDPDSRDFFAVYTRAGSGALVPFR